MSYDFLLYIALILLCTKAMSLFTKKLHLPQVVGALLAGLFLGPSMLGLIKETDFIKALSELGVIVIMFIAGLSTDLKVLKKSSIESLVIALLGTIVPFLMGIGFMWMYTGTLNFEAIFIGIILTATSVTITVETLRELGKLNTNVGNAILGAALIDDVIGIIALSIGMGFRENSSNVGDTLIKILIFFVIATIVGYIFSKLFKKIVDYYNKDMRRIVILGFVFCLILAFVAEKYFGVSSIIGAFIAGAVLSNTKETEYMEERLNTLSYLLLSPMFFASIGLEAEISSLNSKVVIFTLLLALVAISSKIIGCFVGSKFFKFSNKEAIQIGIGMMARGEVALILAKKATNIGIISVDRLTSIILVVIVCATLTPILLKLSFKEKNNTTA